MKPSYEAAVKSPIREAARRFDVDPRELRVTTIEQGKIQHSHVRFYRVGIENRTGTTEWIRVTLDGTRQV